MWPSYRRAFSNTVPFQISRKSVPSPTSLIFYLLNLWHLFWDFRLNKYASTKEISIFHIYLCMLVNSLMMPAIFFTVLDLWKRLTASRQINGIIPADILSHVFISEFNKFKPTQFPCLSKIQFLPQMPFLNVFFTHTPLVI